MLAEPSPSASAQPSEHDRPALQPGARRRTPLTYDAVVIGAGIHGLCAAFWLHRRGRRRIAVLERYGPGHAEGSSHGQTRITRSSYHEREFVKLAAEANQQAWPLLEAELGRALRTPTPGVFFGPATGPFANYLRATLAATDAVATMPTDQARAQFPLLRFDDGDAVLLDRSAAVLHAAETMSGLREWLSAHDVELLWHRPAEHIRTEERGIVVTTAQGEVRANAAIVAAGAEVARLMPSFTTQLTVLQQQVGYFAIEASASALAAGVFPVWARIGHTANDFQYGLPPLEGTAVKVARHRTAGADERMQSPPPIDEAALLSLARERFMVPVTRLSASERCLYTMTPSQGFVIAPDTRSPRLVGIAACSGHGFKFGPAIGRQAVELLP